MTAEAPGSKHRVAALWDAVREALRGTPMDFTSGNLSRAVVLLAIPMVIERMGESLFAIVDALWVSRLGANALAAVGLTESLLEIVYSVAVGLSMATTAMVARRVGERNERGAAAAAVQALLV